MALRDIVSKSIQTLIRLKKGLSTTHTSWLDEIKAISVWLISRKIGKRGENALLLSNQR